MKQTVLWLEAVLVLALLTVSASASQFRNGNFYSAGFQPDGIAVADFNNDGHLDMAIGDYAQGNNVEIFLGNGDGSFRDPLSFAAPRDMAPGSLAAADLNADGITDLVIGGDGIVIASFLGVGDGTFTLAAKYEVSVPLSVAVADLNGDNIPDIAVASDGSSDAEVLIGNGDGTFQHAAHYPLDYGTEDLVISDLNGDGHPDLAVVVFCSPHPKRCQVGEVSVLLNRGDGTFQSPLNFNVGSGPIGIAAADVNHDGTQDLVVTNGSYAAPSTISVLRGKGDGTFAAAVDYQVEDGPIAVAVSDFDGDHNLDLAVCNADSNDLSLLRGHRVGKFHEAGSYPVSGQPVAIALGDFNEDGAPDLAVVILGGAVQLLINTSTL